MVVSFQLHCRNGLKPTTNQQHHQQYPQHHRGHHEHRRIIVFVTATFVFFVPIVILAGQAPVTSNYLCTDRLASCTKWGRTETPRVRTRIAVALWISRTSSSPLTAPISSSPMYVLLIRGCRPLATAKLQFPKAFLALRAYCINLNAPTYLCLLVIVQESFGRK